LALFSLGKKDKKQEPTAPGSPIDQIMTMKQQGKDNNQIIQEMQRQGYNSSQIFDAINQVNISSGNLEPEQPPDMDMQPPPQDYPVDPYPPEPQQQQPQQEPSINKEQIEEIAEAIIDEKWKEFEQDVTVIIDWKEKTEIKINQIEQQIKDLATNLNNLQKSLIHKITEYDTNILDVGTEIKAMEKVFQKVLPSLTENVHKLERMTKGSGIRKK